MTTTYQTAAATAHAISARELNTLMGIITGITADGLIADAEIALMATWLASHPVALAQWPGNAVSRWISDICADGVISGEERAALLGNLSALVSSDFTESGDCSAIPSSLPIDDSDPVDISRHSVVHTGTFLYGTRNRCEQATNKAGGTCMKNVSRKVSLVVVGSMITDSWATETYGRKIMEAMDLKTAGHPIRIISERHWSKFLDSKC